MVSWRKRARKSQEYSIIRRHRGGSGHSGGAQIRLAVEVHYCGRDNCFFG
jgi:hypothetical protein